MKTQRRSARLKRKPTHEEITEFFTAVREGYIDQVKKYTSAGFDVNIVDDEGKTAFMYACLWDHPDIMELLIKAGADVNKQDLEGNTALIMICIDKEYLNGGQEKLIGILMKAGADTTIVNKVGKTAIDYCMTNECVEALLTHQTKRTKTITKPVQWIIPAVWKNQPFMIKTDYKVTRKHLEDGYIVSKVLKTEKMAESFVKRILKWLEGDVDSKSALDILLTESREYIDRLTQRSFDALVKYSTVCSNDWNSLFRTGQKGYCNSNDYDILDRVLENGPENKEEIILTRGLKLDTASQDFINLIRNLKVGDVFEERGFMSTSYINPNDFPFQERSKFLGKDCCLLRITVPPGVRMLAVESLAYKTGYKKYSDQKEIILSPGMGLKLVNITEEKGIKLYEFNCEYCLPGKRFRSSIAPTNLINVISKRDKTNSGLPPRLNVAGTRRVVLTMKDKPRHGWFEEDVFGESVYDFVVDEHTTASKIHDMEEMFVQPQPLFIRGPMNPEFVKELKKSGYKSLFPESNLQLYWFYNKDVIPVISKYVFNNSLYVDFAIDPAKSWLTPSKMKPMVNLSQASKQLYKQANIEKLEKLLGCGLFTDSCIGSMRDYTLDNVPGAKKGYTVSQPLKQYLILARQHLNKLFKSVLYPALKSVNNVVPYVVSGTTAVNYWIQKFGGHEFPVIPTEDYDIKIPSEKLSEGSQILEEKIKKYLSKTNIKELLSKLNERTETFIHDIVFEWTNMQNQPGARRLLAKLRSKDHTQQTAKEFFSYPIVEITQIAKQASNINDYRLKTPNNIYIVSPEYIRDDICKIWTSSAKDSRREAKYNYWNLVFPAGHRLHQPAQFGCD